LSSRRIRRLAAATKPNTVKHTASPFGRDGLPKFDLPKAKCRRHSANSLTRVSLRRRKTTGLPPWRRSPPGADQHPVACQLKTRHFDGTLAHCVGPDIAACSQTKSPRRRPGAFDGRRYGRSELVAQARPRHAHIGIAPRISRLQQCHGANQLSSQSSRKVRSLPGAVC
jgi:hypothetical protein